MAGNNSAKVYELFWLCGFELKYRQKHPRISPLLMSARNGNRISVTPNGEGCTPLHLANQYGNLKTVPVLAAAWADVSIGLPDGTTPSELFLEIRTGNFANTSMRILIIQRKLY